MPSKRVHHFSDEREERITPALLNSDCLKPQDLSEHKKPNSKASSNFREEHFCEIAKDAYRRAYQRANINHFVKARRIKNGKC